MAWQPEPCPGCGGVDVLSQRHEDGIGWEIECSSSPDCNWAVLGLTEEEAQSRWDRREAKPDGWISVSEALPRITDGDYSDYVLVYDSAEKLIAIGFHDSERWMIGGGDITGKYVTHWQPLPDPPARPGHECELPDPGFADGGRYSVVTCECNVCGRRWVKYPREAGWLPILT